MNLGDTHIDSPGVVKALEHLVDRYSDELTRPRAVSLVEAEVAYFRDARVQAFAPVLIEHTLREEARH